MKKHTIYFTTDSADSAESIITAAETINHNVDDAAKIDLYRVARPTQLPVEAYVDATASKAPTPGGGSIAALAGAFGAALNQMVTNLTIGRKKYKAVADEAAALGENAQQLQQQLLDAIQADAEAFDALMVVYKNKQLPADEKARQLEAATIKASEAPLQTARLCLAVAELALEIVRIGNTHAVTDAAAAAFMAEAGMRAAGLNVRINAVNITDRTLAADWLGELDRLEVQVGELARIVAQISAERGGYK